MPPILQLLTYGMYVNKATVHFYTVDGRIFPSSKCQISSVVWKMKRRSLAPAVNDDGGGWKTYYCSSSVKTSTKSYSNTKQTKDLSETDYS